MTDVELKAKVLLQEAAARQAIVDRLLGRAQNRPEFAGILLGGALWALLWISLAVMQVAGRLRALATILERSAVLAQFVGPKDKLLGARPDGSEKPAV